MTARNTTRTVVRRPFIAVSTSAMAVLLAACGIVNDMGGNSSPAGLRKDNHITVGLLLPEKETSRYEKFDYPIIKKQVANLTKDQGRVLYANAEQNAAKQSTQLKQMIADKVDVLLVDPVDAKAIASGIKKVKEAGIPIIAYDRLAQGPIDAYISFDTELIGQVQARALIEALGSNASSRKIVMMNGSRTDPSAGQFKKGALYELQRQVDIAKSYDTKGWKPENAKVNMEEAIRSIGARNIAGVYSANDGMAGAVIDALKEADVSKMPPVTGQDAELAAVQRIVSGDQYMTVYKSYAQEAALAAKMAVTKVQGRSIEFDALTQDKVDSPTTREIPAQLLPVASVTRDNIRDTVIQDGIYTVKDICTGRYRSDCLAIGLK
ncbi:sugar ABC transporter substrate-binding protein [Streptomyces sp. NPDC001177]